VSALFRELECWFHTFSFEMRLITSLDSKISYSPFVGRATYCNGRATAQKKVTNIHYTETYGMRLNQAPPEKASVVG
jgi:hypothetical protein